MSALLCIIVVVIGYLLLFFIFEVVRIKKYGLSYASVQGASCVVDST